MSNQQRIVSQAEIYSSNLLRDRLLALEGQHDRLLGLLRERDVELQTLASFIGASGLPIPDAVRDIIARCMEQTLHESATQST